MINCIFGLKYKCIFVNKLTGIAADWLIAKNCIFGHKNTLCIWDQIYRPLLSYNKPNDKVWMYKEMMMKDDNLESNLLTSSLLKICSLYKFCYKLHMSSWISRWTELCSKYDEVMSVLGIYLYLYYCYYCLSQFTRKYN